MGHNDRVVSLGILRGMSYLGRMTKPLVLKAEGRRRDTNASRVVNREPYYAREGQPPSREEWAELRALLERRARLA